MKITSDLFQAFLKCPTKCWLRAPGESGSGNAYAEWVKSQTGSYVATQTAGLVSESPKDESAVSPTLENFKGGEWRLAIGTVIRAELNSYTLESKVHAIERIPPEGRGRPAKFVPMRFIFTNKLGRDDKLLLAFDALALSETTGREISISKIIRGDDRATVKVKTPALAAVVQKHVEKIATLLSCPTPPDLVLNRHCAECEFQARCRQKAIETDELSLLAGMSAEERQKLRSKGIFTVTQLSYTFRPRRRPKRMRDKREKYHHSLKALAIRQKKIHIVGSPELKIEGTPVYLDVEGLPDRDFYYLIGLRIGNGESVVQHSLWADTVADEGKIWREFLGVLETVEKPVLIHYGSYETTFLKRMGESYGEPMEGSGAAKAIESVLTWAGNGANVFRSALCGGAVYSRACHMHWHYLPADICWSSRTIRQSRSSIRPPRRD
jgi:predicted RecB family nuclease